MPAHMHNVSYQKVTSILDVEFAKEKYGNQLSI
jgi:hypothetical protein